MIGNPREFNRLAGGNADISGREVLKLRDFCVIWGMRRILSGFSHCAGNEDRQQGDILLISDNG
ncbi:MAG TPA: hypothetical protein PLP90_04345, partial [Methanoculleus sp.]|nr:hypothetical protein [Methanoculleus sp.]